MARLLLIPPCRVPPTHGVSSPRQKPFHNYRSVQMTSSQSPSHLVCDGEVVSSPALHVVVDVVVNGLRDAVCNEPPTTNIAAAAP